MRPYDEKSFPPNWSRVKLGDVCEVVRGGSPRPMGDPKYFIGKIPFIKISDITKDDSKFVSDSTTKVNEAGAKKSRLLPKGSLILSNSGSVCIPKFLAVDACIHDGFVSFNNFNTDIDLNYLYHFFNYTRPYVFQKHKQGITQVNLNIDIVSDFDIPLPPLLEQKKIVEKIEELFSGLDSGVVSLKKAKAQIRLYRQSVLASAFSGKLTQSAQRQAHSEMLKAAEPKVDYQNQLPDGWKWVKTSDIIDYIDNGYTPKAELMYSGQGEIPFIKVYNLTFDGKLNFTKNPIFIDRDTHSKNLKRSITIPNDVLINIVGPPLGKVSIVPDTHKEWNINQAIVRFRPNNNILSKFLSYFLQNPSTIQWLESTSRATAGQYNIKVSTCREIPIPQVSIKVQTKIVEEIEKRFSEADNLEKAIDESLIKSETLRQSILKQAFEGRLV